MLKLNHITINVRSMKESIAFYTNAMGFNKLNRVDMGDHILQYFNMGYGVRLELIEYKYHCENFYCNITNKGIYRHIAFDVDDIQLFYRKIIEANYYPINQPEFVEKLGFSYFLIKDPNGVEIEIIQHKS